MAGDGAALATVCGLAAEARAAVALVIAAGTGGFGCTGGAIVATLAAADGNITDRAADAEGDGASAGGLGAGNVDASWEVSGVFWRAIS